MPEFSSGVDSLKQKLIDYMASMDLNHMSIMDLNGYVTILRQLHDMTRPDYMESMAEILKNGFNASAPYAAIPMESEVKQDA